MIYDCGSLHRDVSFAGGREGGRGGSVVSVFEAQVKRSKNDDASITGTGVSSPTKLSTISLLDPAVRYSR